MCPSPRPALGFCFRMIKVLSSVSLMMVTPTLCSFDGQSNTHGMTETSFRDTGLDFMTRGLKMGMKNI